MNRRIAKKRAALAVCLGFDCPMMVNKAKPSFWRLQRRARAQVLARALKRTFHASGKTATRASLLYLGER